MNCEDSTSVFMRLFMRFWTCQIQNTTKLFKYIRKLNYEKIRVGSKVSNKSLTKKLWIIDFIIIIIINIIIIIIITIIIIIIVIMCVSGHFCNTRLFSNSSFSVLCSGNFEVMRLAATRYDETNVDMHAFFILNMEKPKIWMAFSSVIIRIVCTNYSYKLILHE